MEIMIVVSIIGFLAGMAIPTFMKARERARAARCLDNLRKISGAIDEAAMENFLNNGDTITDAQIAPFFKRGIPTCPAGGSYVYGVVGEDPTCTVHSLP